jgi:hypothetical protein
MKPSEVLKNILYKYEKNIEKSTEAFHKGLITSELHRIHKTNNKPKIEMFKKAVEILIKEDL